jgi:hypothetical protein
MDVIQIIMLFLQVLMLLYDDEAVEMLSILGVTKGDLYGI